MLRQQQHHFRSNMRWRFSVFSHRRHRHRASSSSPHERCRTSARIFITLLVSHFGNTNIECIRSQHVSTISISATGILLELTLCEGHANPLLSLSTLFSTTIYVLVACSGQKCSANTKRLFHTVYLTFHRRPVVLNGFHFVFVFFGGAVCVPMRIVPHHVQHEKNHATCWVNRPFN